MADIQTSREAEISLMQDEIAMIRDRLAKFPDALPEWRKSDEAKIARLESAIAKIEKVDA